MPHRRHTFQSAHFALVYAASLAGAILAAPLASAADLDPGYADIPQQQVTFGSGWYIRGDLGVGHGLKISPTMPTFDTTDPTSIPVPPNLDFLSSTDLKYTGSIGAGYQFNNWFRADAIFDYHQPDTASVSGGAAKCPGGYQQVSVGVYEQALEGCLPHYTGSLSTYDILINGYVDLGTYYSITPYIGAGAGVAFGHYSTAATYTQTDSTPYNIMVTDPGTGTTYHADFDSSKSGNFYNFAYAFMAGFSVNILTHANLDIGYRYLNLGTVKGVNANTSIYEHQLRAGIRYMIDN